MMLPVLSTTVGLGEGTWEFVKSSKYDSMEMT